MTSWSDRPGDQHQPLGDNAVLIRLTALEQRVAQLEDALSRANAAIQPPRTRDEDVRDVKPEPHGAPNVDLRKGSPATAIPGFDITVVFDGGSLGNPGKGYGSYQIVTVSGQLGGQRLEFGDNVTNNQAEYRTLVAALRDVTARDDVRPEEASIAVRGDSSLVINQLAGRWKVKHPDLQPLHREASLLLQLFKRRDVGWQPRALSVRVLGH